ncbi:deoxyribodipyrimidine photo-lyase [Candidatus Cyanaurora vandensis]|uniref:cryptochrome/photolyase family protein n=1 Tax=Candidatus Cyanaurora vandensis TaxID=2714958 RepID=UPI00258024B8|nr:deoxyribodipyrimidine photo-lyase [Candidatus Cyanaurora vandensis]
MRTVILWFRRDLRLSDHPALAAALAEQARIVPLFVFDPHLLQHPETGSGRVQFMLGCLESLRKNLGVLGSRLICRLGDQSLVVPAFAQEVGAAAVYWNVDSERAWRTATDGRVADTLQQRGIEARTFEAEALLTAGGPETYTLKYFIPHWHRVLSLRSSPRPTVLPPVDEQIIDTPLRTLADLGLPPCDQMVPTAGEREAHQLLEEFLQEKAAHYLKSLSVAEDATCYTSRLGPHLKFGTISMRTVYQRVQARSQQVDSWQRRNLAGFQSRLFWRDHFAQKLRNLPRCEHESYLQDFDAVPWSNRADHYAAWCTGQTGYPLVDAAMRCLNHTGWLPFRLRALCATFHCIDLLLPWQGGARHFMQKLIDADVAVDHWQWQSHAGVSNRGRNWFRVYNPVDGVAKIDPAGTFIRRWVPELTGVSREQLAAPWRHGIAYLPPLVDHAEARARALALLEPIKRRYAPTDMLDAQ